MLQTVSHPSWIEVDLDQFQKNLRWVQRRTCKSKFCLPVKANAYGHGLVQIAKTAEQCGVDCLGVSCLQEGALLRQAGIEIPIVVLGAFHEAQVEALVHYNLEFTISSQFKAELVTKQTNKRCRVHLEVETGMQRTGVRPETALNLMKYLKNSPSFEVVGVYSHLATSDIPNDRRALEQIAAFQRLISHPLFEGATAHIANSGAVLHYPQSYFDMVRPGILSFGYPTIEEVAPCFSLKSRVSYFKVVEANKGISYGHLYVTRKQTRIVTVPIGYGDGYRRALSNKGSVLIRGKKFPIAGSICMDQLMVDVGDSEVFVGDEVVLIGKQGQEEITLQEVAMLCDTIPYEILVSFTNRVPVRGFE